MMIYDFLHIFIFVVFRVFVGDLLAISADFYYYFCSCFSLFYLLNVSNCICVPLSTVFVMIKYVYTLFLFLFLLLINYLEFYGIVKIRGKPLDRIHPFRYLSNTSLF